MELQTFRETVTSYKSSISDIADNLGALYTYAGLPIKNNLSRQLVTDAIYKKIRDTFTSGRGTAFRQCCDWLDELIQDHVINDAHIDPFYSVLSHLRDALRSEIQPGEVILGNWADAIHHACDSVELHDWTLAGEIRERSHARTFEVARSAKRLQDAGYQISRSGNRLYFDATVEDKVARQLETLVMKMGGMNVARRIFQKISSLYDAEQERYHVVPRPQTTGGGHAQIPFGYLLQLAIKHISGNKPYNNTDEIWNIMCSLATDYAAMFDVQPYYPNIMSLPQDMLIRHLQELALYDTLFRLPQLRATDFSNIASGLLRDVAGSRTYGKGWTFDEALAVCNAVLSFSVGHRGPVLIKNRLIKKACAHIDSHTVQSIIDDVLTHPASGANQNFTKPSDAPTDESRSSGHNFFTRPLLRHNSSCVILLDRSVSAPAFLEALMSPLRAANPSQFDSALGRKIEEFLCNELIARHIPTLSGNYQTTDGEGECDVIIESENVILFLEIKKKPLTRRARSGSDVHIVIDLAQSLLAAQLQAGWHEIRLRRDGYLDLWHQGNKTRVEIKDRQIERIAVSLLDFGSFQDRVLLERFLSATARIKLNPIDASLQPMFDTLNASLDELRTQMTMLARLSDQRPFFNCWFLSLPQLLIILDRVDGPEDFKKALWKTRHIITGSNDLYYDFYRMSQISVKNAGPEHPLSSTSFKIRPGL